MLKEPSAPPPSGEAGQPIVAYSTAAFATPATSQPFSPSETSSAVAMATNNGATECALLAGLESAAPVGECSGRSPSTAAAASTAAPLRRQPTPHPFFLTFSRWKTYCSQKYHAKSKSQQDLIIRHPAVLRQQQQEGMEVSAAEKQQQQPRDWTGVMTSPPPSITGTPTLVRARPRLPLGLIKPGSRGGGKEEVEDLSVAFSSLGTTDFVRKYSRKCRNSGANTPSGNAASSVPTPGSMRSPLFSPTPESGQGHHTRTGSLTLKRMRSIKLKLQKVKETQELEEKQTEPSEITSKDAEEPPSDPVPQEEAKHSTLSPSSSNSLITVSVNRPITSYLHTGTKIVFSSLQDLSKISESDSDSQWHPVMNTPEQFREASKALATKMPQSPVPTEQCKPEGPEKKVSLRRKLFSLKNSVSTDSDASTTSVPPKLPVMTDSFEGASGSEPANRSCSFDTEDDEGLGAMDEATEEDGIRIRVPQIVAPGSDRKRRSRKGRKKDDRLRSKQDADKSNGSRFLTHPTLNDNISCEEPCSMDSDLAVIRVHSANRLSPQRSVASIDSSLSSSDTVAPFYADVVQDVVAADTLKPKHERKNSKQLKQKSKSDPCGNKQSVDISSVISAQHTQSEPVLEKDKQPPTTDSSEDIAKERKISKSENLLIHTDEELQPIPEVLSPSKLIEVRVAESSADSCEEVKSPVPAPRQRSKRAKKKSHTVANIIQRLENRDDQEEEGSRSDRNPETGSRGVRIRISDALSRASPDGDKKSKRSTLASLTLPLSGKKSSISRSQSSASVVNKPKNLPIGPASADPKRRPRLPEQLTKSASSDSNRSSKTSTSFAPSLAPLYPQGSLSLFEGAPKEKVKRDLIVQEFYSTEEDYVETLQMLVEKFMIPMKSSRTIDNAIVDDIFYKFSKQTVIESYISFIENFPKAEKVLDEISNKSAFQKFVEQTERQSRTKLPLKAMIIKPAQRIPRYELLIKRLLEHTPTEHPDCNLLTKAQSVIHRLALQINSVQENRQGEDMQDTLKKLELMIMTDLVQPERQYLRHDMINIMSRKDPYCVWLFSDLVIFSSIKRKSGPVNRRITLLLWVYPSTQSPSGNDFVENVKHKMWLKVALDGLEILKGSSGSQQRPLVDKDLLEEDFRVLTNIIDLTQNLNCQHENLDDVVHQLQSHVNKQLSEHQLKTPPPEANTLQLLATTTEGLTAINLVFNTPEKRNVWEGAFSDAKQKLADNVKEKPPEFIQAMPITKTRAGMQFSCAAPIEGMNAQHERDVWVCNSDGYVGHMCLLSLQPEPIVTLNTPLPGCNSRILCICAVPGQPTIKRRGSGRRHGVTQIQAPNIHLDDVIRLKRDDEDDDESKKKTKKPKGGAEKDASSDSDSSDEFQDAEDKDPKEKETTKEQEECSRSGTPERQANRTPFDNTKSAMWLGTEDGCILIFPSTENIKTTKNKVKLQQNAGVLSLLYYDHRVFASLTNGDVVVFRRLDKSRWDLEEPEVLSVSNASAPVNKMQMVAGRLWCTSHCEIFVINPTDLHIKATFQANPDCKRGMHCIAASGLGVWLAPQGGSTVLLYHATTYQQLMKISIKQAVAQKLQATDDIIRQHKTACLRVTSLLACKDLLWIGTSAGVLLTVPMPKISSTTTKSDLTPPEVSGLVHGHTGHVRFLTCVDLPQPKFLASFGSQASGSPPDVGVPRRPSWLQRSDSLTTHTLTLATKMLIISGGDGYEDFRSCANAETAGKDDSINHLLLWQV
ncbi:hypothetical protein CAPTEDRAFT_222014 [Capitella teleta]|uniref:DH domain-containing protein n=2 Tax=Capitella teleta TaxID=283909 RepID=R7VEC0_CAPTE|nr:hypothetical protein CAPTEDRAFT_222014 [Capitella teleta]|eukprot:ELU16927.1 hypothetical protein CAPTEDRAFT_222014 [Capitella teleta]